MNNGSKELAVDVQHVSFRYDNKKVLDNVTLKISQGTFLGLVGPNGSGKSTLIKLILGILQPDEGEISVFGTPIAKLKNRHLIGFVSQKANSFNGGFPATVLEVVLSGLVAKVGLFKMFTKKHKQRALQAIASVGMSEYINHNIGELSGGQQQRVFIARALVSEPKLLILDEPTVGIDIKNVESFYSMLAQLNKQNGLTLIMVSHDIGTMTNHASHVACLNKSLHFHGDSEQFHHMDNSALSKIYGHDLHLLTHDHHHGGAH
ncbi:metal ABC transporter ATP-binding protein [Calidifontibacillus oryziterrae]|uniref:metal ABC transporter ATP-binding protein n=1 Tax=Calidifontibacillus oryziterrae TaxID=1191699 RepID=UPI0002DCD81F|nr:metal ABC transporter ATP-binding protein [Calidifontibacillus oryziterrae]